MKRAERRDSRKEQGGDRKEGEDEGNQRARGRCRAEELRRRPGFPSGLASVLSANHPLETKTVLFRSYILCKSIPGPPHNYPSPRGRQVAVF